ncbi:MAG: hypothetical protein E7441_07040 [Ruminococcaceae bacterium]|nr:hypothetical protein [Oscillospiraceae bacterium]
MKKTTKIFFVVVLLILAGAAAFCVWQWENIRAVYMYIVADGENSVVPSGMEVLEIPGLSGTEKENDLPDGDREDVSGAEKNVKRSSRAPATAETRDAEITQEEGKTYLKRCREELYACEAALVSRVGGMKNEVLAEWRALPKEQRTSRKKREMIISGVSRCLSLEGEIDGKVKGIIAKYKARAAEAGESTDEITALWDEYKAKKASTKAYYLNKYLG